MGKFALKTKDGETISTIEANDIIDASVSLAETKKLDLDDLLMIYVIEEI